MKFDDVKPGEEEFDPAWQTPALHWSKAMRVEKSDQIVALITALQIADDKNQHASLEASKLLEAIEACGYTLTALPPAHGGAEAVAGWIVGNGNGDKWRSWDNSGPIWVDSQEQATRYHRREDAELVHADDDDAWTVIPYPEQHDWHEWHNMTCCRKCGFIKRADGKNKPCKGVVRVEFRIDRYSPTQEQEAAQGEAVAWEWRWRDILDRAPWLPVTESQWQAYRIEFRRVSAPPSPEPEQEAVAAEEPAWIVNDLGELGVRVGDRFFFLYKGDNIEYGEHDSRDGIALHDDGTPMRYRVVGKREFGETQWPVKWVRQGWRSERYTEELQHIPGLSSEDVAWRDLPAKGQRAPETPE